MSASQPVSPQPIPTELIVPIIQAFADGIRPGFAFILIPTIFGSMLVPMMILLFALSTPHTRRTPIFILNVVAVGLGIFSSVLGTHLTVTAPARSPTQTQSFQIKSILSPFAGVIPGESELSKSPNFPKKVTMKQISRSRS
jgi:hypothetical protein